ncbi:MAG: glycosyltransferase [Clostridia bacterium]|nr:glycosyltransferase [Clostridia bacterium]
MNVLMLGTVVPEETKEYCFSMGQRTSTADAVQNYMIHGLEKIDEVETIDSIGSVRLKAWPRSRILSLKDSEERRTKGKTIGVGYKNIPFFGFRLREKALIKAAKKWAAEHREDSDAMVIIYSMHSPFMKAAKEIKRMIPSAKIALTVADLPLFMDMRGIVRKVLKRLDWKRITGLMRYIDKYLLYTKYMAEYLGLQDGQWILFEGIMDESRIVTEKQRKADERYALYAGNLDARYGIDQLIDAFSRLSNQEKLVIYGAGFDKERIENMAGALPNVEYRGQISPDEVFRKMKEATILINPRPASIALAKYSCPSKTFEYLASGTPIIMNRLPGLPDEYLNYVSLFSGETADDYARDIRKLFSLSENELSEIGLRGAEFLKNQKSSAIIMKKVYDFVKE